MRITLIVPDITISFTYINVLTLGSTALTNRLYNVKIQKARDWKE